MAALLVKPAMTISLENIMQMAVNKGYTAQGEMFSGTQLVNTVRKEALCLCRTQHKSVFLYLNAKLHSHDAYGVCANDTGTVLTAISLFSWVYLCCQMCSRKKKTIQDNSPKRKKWKRNYHV